MRYDSLSKNRIYIFSAHGEMQQSVDQAYPFHQEPYFFWLAGLNEPNWQLIVNTYTGERVLFAPKRDETRTLFDGSLDDAIVRKTTDTDAIIERKDQADYLRSLAAKHDTVHMIGSHPHRRYFHHLENTAPRNARKRAGRYFAHVVDCRQELDTLRAIKSKAEVRVMRQAVDTSIQGFEALRQKLSTGVRFEYELEAELNFAFRVTGAGGHAYAPIVASGQNACTLHYGQNTTKLPDNGLVLIDTGAVVDGYAADITRTYAIGTPTKRQVEVHGAVQRAHHKIISLIKPGISLVSYLKSSDEIMKDALQEVGLLKDRGDEKTYRQYFPHAISHGLGLDVHESLGGYKEFMPGMVLTVEPGIYIPEEGIGVRIEDDILVTNDGNENLSGHLSTSL